MADKAKNLLHEAALQRIAEQEARIARQKLLVANLASHGAGISAAERMLATMQDGLTVLRTSLPATGARNDASQ